MRPASSPWDCNPPSPCWCSLRSWRLFSATSRHLRRRVKLAGTPTPNPGVAMRLLSCLIVCGLALVALIETPRAAELNPAAVAFTLPDKIEWKSPRPNAGVLQAVMVGDPSRPGLYAVLTKWLPGNKSRPHFQPKQCLLTVVKGTWDAGTGTTF